MIRLWGHLAAVEDACKRHRIEVRLGGGLYTLHAVHLNAGFRAARPERLRIKKDILFSARASENLKRRYGPKRLGQQQLEKRVRPAGR